MNFDELFRLLFEQPTILTRFIETAVIIFILWLARRLLLIRVNKTVEDPDKIYAWRKGSQYFVLFQLIGTMAVLWFDGFDNATTYLGLLSAGIAIALQDPLINIVGWIYILARHPFEVGDRIEIGDVAGDVIDIEILRFSLLEIGNWVDAEQSTGRVIHVPNRQCGCQPGRKRPLNQPHGLITTRLGISSKSLSLRVARRNPLAKAMDAI